MIRLQALRKQRRMTQSQLGRHLNISRSTISQWESEKKQPGLEDLIRLADFFQVSLDYLVGRSDHLEVERQLNEKFTAHATVGSIMTSVLALPAEYHDALVGILDAFHCASAGKQLANSTPGKKQHHGSD